MIASLGRITDPATGRRIRVVLDDEEGNYLIDKDTNVWTPFRKENHIYKMKVKVKGDKVMPLEEGETRSDENLEKAKKKAGVGGFSPRCVGPARWLASVPRCFW